MSGCQEGIKKAKKKSKPKVVATSVTNTGITLTWMRHTSYESKVIDEYADFLCDITLTGSLTEKKRGKVSP